MGNTFSKHLKKFLLCGSYHKTPLNVRKRSRGRPTRGAASSKKAGADASAAAAGSPLSSPPPKAKRVGSSDDVPAAPIPATTLFIDDLSSVLAAGSPLSSPPPKARRVGSSDDMPAAPISAVTLFVDDLSLDGDPLAERSKELLSEGAINGIAEETKVSRGLAAALPEDPNSCTSAGKLSPPSIQVIPRSPEDDVFISDEKPFDPVPVPVLLHGYKCPVSRISLGGSLYGAVNSPVSTPRSLNDEEIEVKRMTFPKSAFFSYLPCLWCTVGSQMSSGIFFTL